MEKKNGKGKDYYDIDKLKFEGEYLNGERNGKGKEYYNDGELEFVGEYLKGKKWTGTGYNKNGNLENEIKDGKGNLKEYYNDKLIFEGEYLNGERNGKGKEYNYNGQLRFEGVYLNGIRNGEGKEYYYNYNIRYIGKYFNGNKWNGTGYNINGYLEYELKNGKGYIKEYNFLSKLEYE